MGIAQYLVFAMFRIAAINASFNASELCLHCLCISMDQCNTTVGCKGDPGSYVCGPYAITYEYWKDSGYPVLEEEATVDIRGYVRCVNDFKCAKKCVEQYMNRYKMDCNNDGDMTCSDYFYLHYFGPSDCGIAHPKTKEENVFDVCISKMAASVT
uniref:lysozyme n=1 Tax=Clastoptera arizonana TaxID=38151 RepID=A0A1B6DBK3_9HEMI